MLPRVLSSIEKVCILSCRNRGKQTELMTSPDYTYSIFELFFCKKIPLSRRVEYVMDWSMDESVSQ